VEVVRDTFGVPHVTASDDHDVYFMMGYVHAQDRFFQMDVLRRAGRGALAELLGSGPRDEILGSDVEMRAIGLHRAAERSLGIYSPEALALIQAYTDGVNTWLDSNSLPPEYAALEITQVPRWRPIDSITIAKLDSFLITFETADVSRTSTLLRYQATGQAFGFDGTRLFFEDLFRVAPFAAAVTNPSSSATVEPGSQDLRSQMIENASQVRQTFSPELLNAARKFVERHDQNPLLNRAALGAGSNWWIVAGSKTTTGNAMLANDPHLDLGTPATFYEIHLTVDSRSAPMNVYGVSFAGVPGVSLGQNDRISWGATTCALDVTDFFAESLVVQNGAPVATRYQGRAEPLVVSPEEFKINQPQNGVADDVVAVAPGDRPGGVSVPPAIFLVPRRNNGPLIPASLTEGFSFLHTGLGATRDLEGVFALARAKNLSDFKQAIQLQETSPISWAYADVDGNIATFVGGKVPLREDLQAGIIDGLPPFFLRDGTGAARNEWVLKNDGGPEGGYESLPFEEMPQTVNPAQGFLVNANNDPIGITLDNNLINQRLGDGIYYLSAGFNSGIRAAKITSLINQRLNSNYGHGKISFGDMQRIQGNVQMYDAEVLTPHIIRAFNASRRAGAPPELAALGKDPAIIEAVRRLSNWDFSAPTGIFDGYDAGDKIGVHQRPSDHEVANSVAATIYNVWRSQVLTNTIVATLQRVGLDEEGGPNVLVALKFLLDNFSTNQGIGASGLDFFEIPGVDAPPQIRRDSIILQSLKDALNLLASDAFAEAFNGSTNQNSYRWGKLHRKTFSHIFGILAPQFSIPTAGDFTDLSPTLPGLAIDGGYETIDIGTYKELAASSNTYTFGAGAARRYVGELRRGGIKAAQVIPGGESGVLGSPLQTNQLPLWLTNRYHDVFFSRSGVECHSDSKTVYKP
jgi:penicillin amidase